MFVLIARWTSLRGMPALAASCLEASRAYRRPDLWCGKITVEQHMVTSTVHRAHFLKWLYGVCNTPGLHIELWFGIKSLMATNSEAYDLISSAVLTCRCSHDLFCRGFCMHDGDKPGCFDVRELIASSGSRVSVRASQDKVCGIISDGPVASIPFSFTMTVHPRTVDRRLGIFELGPVEGFVGYVPWPPTPESFREHGQAIGGFSIGIGEGDLEGDTATFELRILDGRVQLWNISLERDVQATGDVGLTVDSPTGVYAFHCWSNCNEFTLSMSYPV